MVQVERVKGELPGSLTAWRITAYAQTKAEAFAKAIKVEEVEADAFKPLPVTAPEIAHQDGHTADGGGIVLDTELSPEIRAAMLRACPTGDCDV